MTLNTDLTMSPQTLGEMQVKDLVDAVDPIIEEVELHKEQKQWPKMPRVFNQLSVADGRDVVTSAIKDTNF